MGTERQADTILSMGANTAEIEVGRLLEVRASGGYRTVADVDALFDKIDDEFAKLQPRTALVTVVDWRQCPVMNPEAATRIVERITRLNGRTERSAALATESAPSAVLQFMRLIRESKLDDRRMFFDAKKLIAWLDKVLNEEERQRLRSFLNG